jgi:hypothetical protein
MLLPFLPIFVEERGIKQQAAPGDTRDRGAEVDADRAEDLRSIKK